ncbi:glycoside hydrolase family 30 protein [Puia sp.]|uniref:glycoside hydrolase family 30 protein n=1 Tax=Puia sp. TaxID=2045100 RepID=UPI002F42FFCF
MRPVLRSTLMTVAFGCAMGTLSAQKDRPVAIWLTDPAHSVFFQRQPELPMARQDLVASDPVITLDEKKTFQHVDGFGWALTGGSAQHLMKMSPAARNALLRELFTTDSNHIGGSYLRVSIGASDLNDHAFSYDDLPAGKTDTPLAHFDLGPDKNDVIPILQQIIAINPEIKILGSPWSAPAWMKNNHDTRGGSLLPQYYRTYANYLVKYILTMQQQGIGINAITVQNEPLHPGNNPSMYMPAVAEAAFVKVLGPAIEQERLDTKIIVYDHNADRPDYPDSIYRDAEAAKWVDGAAFHLYGGKIEALTPLHDSFPDKNLYFTEQWVGAPGDPARDIPENIDKLIVGAMRNWCKTVIEWNLTSNPQLEPHTDRGGCDRCLGAVTLDGDVVKRNPAYYIIAHAAKYVRPGSARIVSNSDEQLPNVAFRTPTGQAVLIVLNNTKDTKGFSIELKGKRLHTTLNSGAVATYVFQL